MGKWSQLGQKREMGIYIWGDDIQAI